MFNRIGLVIQKETQLNLNSGNKQYIFNHTIYLIYLLSYQLDLIQWILSIGSYQWIFSIGSSYFRSNSHFC
jgi:hypothetical protein